MADQFPEESFSTPVQSPREKECPPAPRRLVPTSPSDPPPRPPPLHRQHACEYICRSCGDLTSNECQVCIMCPKPDHCTGNHM